MLVLTRKSQESVVVSPDGLEALLKVTVLEIAGGRVRLGFEADDAMSVHRWEVWKRILGRGSTQRIKRKPTASAA